jgi:hypothetical protein
LNPKVQPGFTAHVASFFLVRRRRLLPLSGGGGRRGGGGGAFGILAGLLPEDDEIVAPPTPAAGAAAAAANWPRAGVGSFEGGSGSFSDASAAQQGRFAGAFDEVGSAGSFSFGDSPASSPQPSPYGQNYGQPYGAVEGPPLFPPPPTHQRSSSTTTNTNHNHTAKSYAEILARHVAEAEAKGAEQLAVEASQCMLTLAVQVGGRDTILDHTSETREGRHDFADS